jgi:hypothetical protein
MAKETSISRPRLNAEWHRANRIPAKPTLDQRIAWHLAHAEACGCRKMPAGIVAELKQRGMLAGQPPSGRS